MKKFTVHFGVQDIKMELEDPTVDEVTAYITEAQLSMNADSFVDFYASKGWRVGASSMKDWKAAARNWNRRDNPAKAKEDYSEYL